MLGKKKTSEIVVDKINNTQRAALASVIKQIQKGIEDRSGRSSWEYDLKDRVQKIMESDPIITDLNMAINDLRRKLAEAEDRKASLVGKYGAPTDPDALVRYNKLLEQEKVKIPNAVADCSNAVLNVWSVATLSEAKGIADDIVSKYGSNTRK
jgi:hypothetical protein